MPNCIHPKVKTHSPEIRQDIDPPLATVAVAALDPNGTLVSKQSYDILETALWAIIELSPAMSDDATTMKNIARKALEQLSKHC